MKKLTLVITVAIIMALTSCSSRSGHKAEKKAEETTFKKGIVMGITSYNNVSNSAIIDLEPFDGKPDNEFTPSINAQIEKNDTLNVTIRDKEIIRWYK